MPTEYDRTAPWNRGVEGGEILPLINDDAAVMRVSAGPGTGKTFGLVRRVVRLLHTQGLGALGSEVLVVAFNRVIAAQLLSDISSALTSEEIGKEPTIRTVHALCLSVLGEEHRLLLPHEWEAMIYDLLESHAAVADTYSDWRATCQAFRDLEAGHADDPTLWAAGRNWLDKHQANLVGDLPTELSRRLKLGDFSTHRYEHVIADEFQDLTHAEQDLVLRLRRPGGQLVALGDARQSIYAFRGNDRMGLDRLEDLTDNGEGITDIALKECRRCPEGVVAAANRLMVLTTPLESIGEQDADVYVVRWKTPASEAKGMADHILTSVRAHPDDRHLAMVTRRQFGYRLREELKKLDDSLDVDLSFSESILELWAVREAFLWFCLLADPDPPTWRAWLGYKNSLDGKQFKAPRRNSRAYLNLLSTEGGAINWETIRGLQDVPRSAGLGRGFATLWDRAKRARDLAGLHQWQDFDAKSVIETAFDPSLWVTDEMDGNATANLDLELLGEAAVQILGEQANYDDPEKKETHLRTVARTLRLRIATREPFETSGVASVQVATLWGAKGLTADHVYVLGLCDEAIPGIVSDDYPGTEGDFIEEQRRLFYVSITRPRHTLVLSRPDRIKPGDAKKLNLRAAGGWHYATLHASRFLTEIASVLPEGVAGEDWSTGWNPGA